MIRSVQNTFPSVRSRTILNLTITIMVMLDVSYVQLFYLLEIIIQKPTVHLNQKKGGLKMFNFCYNLTRYTRSVTFSAKTSRKVSLCLRDGVMALDHSDI